MDLLSKIQAKMDALNSNTMKSAANADSNKLKFSPSEGKYVIRILPNFTLGKDQKPYLPLDFYYNFGKRTWLAPCQFDEPDAIADFYQSLVAEYTRERDKEKNKELYNASLDFKPKMRICVPILVRSYTDASGKTTNGLESEGIKFWWFSPKTYRDLEQITSDPDYGNIFDLKSGRDITLEYTPKEKTTTGYPSISILPKPKETPVSTDSTILETIKNMPNIIESFTKPTFEETEKALADYLKGNKKETATQSNKEFLEEMNKPVTPKPQQDVKTPNVADIDLDFDNMFDE